MQHGSTAQRLEHFWKMSLKIFSNFLCNPLDLDSASLHNIFKKGLKVMAFTSQLSH